MKPDWEKAQARLETALRRIEAGVAARRAAGGAADVAALQAERDALADEVAKLRAANDRLAADLQRTEAERAKATAAAGQVSDRLDGAIDQLKLVLDN